MLPGLTGESKSEVLIELMAGILLYGVVGQIVLFFFSDILPLSISWWIGVVTAIACSYHIWWILDSTLGEGEGVAIKKAALMSAVRYILMVIVVVAVMVTKVGNPLITIFGMLGLKIGAYLQPFIHYILNGKRGK